MNRIELNKIMEYRKKGYCPTEQTININLDGITDYLRDKDIEIQKFRCKMLEERIKSKRLEERTEKALELLERHNSMFYDNSPGYIQQAIEILKGGSNE